MYFNKNEYCVERNCLKINIQMATLRVICVMESYALIQLTSSQSHPKFQTALAFQRIFAFDSFAVFGHLRELINKIVPLIVILRF